MNQKLTRRRFTQLALATSTVAAFAAMTKKATAYSNALIYGVNVNSNRLVLQALDLPSLTIQDQSNLIGNITLASNDQLTAFTSLDKDTVVNGVTLAKGTLVVAVTSIVLSNRGSYPTRLIFLGPTSITLNLSDIGAQFILNSVLSTSGGKLLVLINELNSLPPFKVGSVNPQTGQITFITELDQTGGRSFGNVTQCADGRILAIATDQLGNPNLVQLDPAQSRLSPLQQLSFSVNDGPRSIDSLACSPSGQIFALSSRRYDSTNSLFFVDSNTGVLSQVRDFPVIKMTFSLS